MPRHLLARSACRNSEAVGLALVALEGLFYIAAGIFPVRMILELGVRQRVRARWIAAGAAAGLERASAG